MRFEKYSFGSIRIDGVTYEHDVVIDRGKIHKRQKKPSRKFRDSFGHTPLSVEEKIPWKCRRLVIGTGAGALPVMSDVKREAQRRKIKLLILPTKQAAYPEATVTGAVFMTAFTTKSAVYVLIRGYAGTELLVWLGAAMAVYGVVYAVRGAGSLGGE